MNYDHTTPPPADQVLVHSLKDETVSKNLTARIGFYLGPLLLITCLVTSPPLGMSSAAWVNRFRFQLPLYYRFY